MTSNQRAALSFWSADKRKSAIFEGRTIGVEDLATDAALADRYWRRQGQACHANREAARAKHNRARAEMAERNGARC